MKAITGIYLLETLKMAAMLTKMRKIVFDSGFFGCMFLFLFCVFCCCYCLFVVLFMEERPLMVQWVFGSIRHGKLIELVLVPANAPRLSVGWCI